METATAAYKLYSEELEKARIITESRGRVFSVVDPLVLPEDADPTGRAIIIMLALVVGHRRRDAFPVCSLARGMTGAILFCWRSIIAASVVAFSHIMAALPFFRRVSRQESPRGIDFACLAFLLYYDIGLLYRVL